MPIMKDKSLTRYIPCVLLVALAALIFILSEYIQWIGDSYLYRFHFGTGEPIVSFGEIFSSQYAHYFSMNGRVWAHVLCQGFSALWGQTAFAVCNSLIYVIFTLLFVKVVGGSWRNVATLMSCILVILFYADTSYNANFQIGYFWTATVDLLFILLYVREDGGLDLRRWWKGPLLFIISLLAGNGNEAIAIGIGAALIFDFVTRFKSLNAARLVMLSGFGIGGLILCLSPGTIHLALSVEPSFFYSIYHLLINSRMLYLFLLTILILRIRKRIVISEFVRSNSFFFVALCSLLIFNLAIGIFSCGRQLLGMELFAAIFTIRALRTRAFPTVAIVILTMVVVAQYALKFQYLQVSNEDLRLLRTELENAEDDTVYIDFHKYNSLVRPTEVVGRMQYYSLYEVTSILDDMDDFGHTYLCRGSGVRHDLCPGKLRIYPTQVKDVIEAADKNFAMKCDDGTFLLMQDKKHPATFILHRQLNVLGFTYPLHSHKVSFYDDGPLNFDDVNVMLERFEIPFVENLYVEMIRD